MKQYKRNDVTCCCRNNKVQKEAIRITAHLTDDENKYYNISASVKNKIKKKKRQQLPAGKKEASPLFRAMGFCMFIESEGSFE